MGCYWVIYFLIGRVLMTILSWWLVVSLVVLMISSVLSLFNLKFWVTQDLMYLMQASTWDMAVCLNTETSGLIITRDSEVIMLSPCVFVCVCVSVCLSVCLCLSRCLSRRFNYEGLVPHKQYFAGTFLGMSSYVSLIHNVIDDVTRSQSRSNFEIDTKCRKC